MHIILEESSFQGVHLPLGRGIIIKLELLHSDWKVRRLSTVHWMLDAQKTHSSFRRKITYSKLYEQSIWYCLSEALFVEFSRLRSL